MHADPVFQPLQIPSNASSAPKSDEDFLSLLDRDLRPRMIASLKSRGASRDLAEDLVSEILSECVAESPHNLLGRFKGQGPIDGWLLRVAINRLISRQRRERLMEPAEIKELDSLPCENSQQMEGALHGIVSRALRGAIESLPAESRLLLWLRHGYGIQQNRLCTCWRSTPTKISRALSSARDTVRERTLRSIQKEEPGLHLEWQDISGVCADSDLFSEKRHVA
jgi:RNA polymerase sigma factor (sigma-70 family)